MESARGEPLLKAGGGVVMVLVAVAVASVAVDWATGPFLARLGPREWLAIHLAIVGLWAIVWIGWKRGKARAEPVVIATLVVAIWPVLKWLIFGWCLIAHTCDF
jgi:hypothetical protein